MNRANANINTRLRSSSAPPNAKYLIPNPRLPVKRHETAPPELASPWLFNYKELCKVLYTLLDTNETQQYLPPKVPKPVPYPQYQSMISGDPIPPGVPVNIAKCGGQACVMTMEEYSEALCSEIKNLRKRYTGHCPSCKDYLGPWFLENAFKAIHRAPTTTTDDDSADSSEYAKWFESTFLITTEKELESNQMAKVTHPVEENKTTSPPVYWPPNLWSKGQGLQCIEPWADPLERAALEINHFESHCSRLVAPLYFTHFEPTDPRRLNAVIKMINRIDKELEKYSGNEQMTTAIQKMKDDILAPYYSIFVTEISSQ